MQELQNLTDLLLESQTNLQNLQSTQPEERAGFEKRLMDTCLLIKDSTVKKNYISFFFIIVI